MSASMVNCTLKLMVAGSSSMFCTMHETMALLFVLKASLTWPHKIVTMATRGVKNGVSNDFSKWFP